MTMQADVVIIGGAVMGASCAYWLTRMQPGLDVLVVERDPSFAQASTALSVASIRSQFSTAVNVAISRFGIGFIRDFQQSLGVDVGIGSLGLKENGYLFRRTARKVPRCCPTWPKCSAVWAPRQKSGRPIRSRRASRGWRWAI